MSNIRQTETKKEANDHLTWPKDLSSLILATTVVRIVNGMDEPYPLNPEKQLTIAKCSSSTQQNITCVLIQV